MKSKNCDQQRLDRWLWASRFYKTRKLAGDAVRAGHVDLNDKRVKPARIVRVNNKLTVRKNQLDYCITVLALSEKRLGAALAQQLYEESDESRQRREQQIESRQMNLRGVRYERQKPTSRQRQEMTKMKRNPLL